MLALAEWASFEAFVNCYVHEFGCGSWHRTVDWSGEVDARFPGRGDFVLELQLSGQDVRLALDVTYRSAVGCHGFGCLREQRGTGVWRDGDALHAMLCIVRELYSQVIPDPRRRRLPELEFIARLVQSMQVLTRYLDDQVQGEARRLHAFIESEQSMPFGHWRHPTPKSRQGMADWHHARFAPELRGRFPLHVFAVRRSLVEQDSAVSGSAAALIEEFLGGDPAARAQLALARARDEVLLPVHPLQADWLLHQPHTRRWIRDGLVREVGPLGPPVTATSSVRTVYCADSRWMLKLSLPVRITNSLRFCRRHELVAGVLMARLFQRLGPRATAISVVADPAYLTVRGPDGGDSGFEVILRDNPFRGDQSLGVHCVAALTQRPRPGQASPLRTLIEGLALAEGRNVQTVGREWLVRYLHCAIEPLIRLYDEHGIALEAHQQNGLLDVAGGYPRRFFYRDNQGYYLSRSRRDRLVDLVPGLEGRPELFFDDAVVRKHLSYYLFCNQLFSVIHRLGAEGLLPEDVSLGVLHARLSRLAAQLGGPGLPLVRSVLRDRSLPYKANLLTRLVDRDELECEAEGGAAYVEIDNPLSYVPSSLDEEAELEVA